MSPSNSLTTRRKKATNAESVVSSENGNSEDLPSRVSAETAQDIIGKLRALYSAIGEILKRDSKLTRFCLAGNIKGVKKLLRTSPGLLEPELDPDLSSIPGYISQVVIGSHTNNRTRDSVRVQREELIQYLCEQGCPVDQVDTMECTAFVHCFLFEPQLRLAKILLDNGANINHRMEIGLDAMGLAIMSGDAQSVQFLVHHGAEIDLGGTHARGKRVVHTGPGESFEMLTVTTRLGKKPLAPPPEMPCAMCKGLKQKLQSCGRCRLAQYCSKECQRAHWKEHKSTCFGSLNQRVVVVKPNYDLFVAPLSHKVMKGMINGTSKSESLHRMKNRTRDRITSSSNMILKIQVDRDGSNPFIYAFDKHLTFTCAIRQEDNPVQYVNLFQFIAQKGIPAFPGGPGVKVYLLADLKQQDELVFKLGNVLEDQTF